MTFLALVPWVYLNVRKSNIEPRSDLVSDTTQAGKFVSRSECESCPGRSREVITVTETLRLTDPPRLKP